MNQAPPPSPEAPEAAFYAAFEAADLEAMMRLWCDDQTVVCIHPGGERHVGLEEVRESWRRIFAGSGQLRMHVAQSVSASTPAMSVRCVIEYIGVRGVRGTVPVVATNMFRRAPEGWRLWMHHASPHPASLPGGTGEDSGHSNTPGNPGDEPQPTLH